MFKAKKSVLLRERSWCRRDERALLLPKEAEGPLMLLLQRIGVPALLRLEQLLLLLYQLQLLPLLLLKLALKALSR